jgi:hypothetical protein
MCLECGILRRIRLNFQKNFRRRGGWKSAVFARVFEGGFRKCGAQRWFFCGEFVVDCVIFVVVLMVIVWL